MRPSRLLSLLFVLTACPETETADADFAATLESDVEELARLAVDVGVQANTVSECVEGPDDCSICYEAVGTPLSGTFTAGADPLPCSASFTGEGGATTTYTIESSAFSGGWSAAANGVTVEMTGARTATLRRDGARRDVDVSSAMTLDALSLTVDGTGAVTAFSADLTYVGFGGRTYAVELTGDGATIEGTATSAAVTCSLSGTREAPVVDCAG